MNKLIILLAMLVLASCGQPQPVPAIMPQVVTDTVPTITLSDEDTVGMQITSPTTIVEFGQGGLNITSPNMELNQTVDIRKLCVEMDGENVKSISINGDIVYGEKETKEYQPPFTLVGKDRIRLHDGATLRLVARYYGTSVPRLLHCNPSIKNSDDVRSGDIILINCCDDCR